MDNKSDLKSAGSKSNRIDSWTKVGLWLFVPGVILTILEFTILHYLINSEWVESTLKDWGGVMIVPLILIGYGALFLLPVLLVAIGSFFIKFKVIRSILELALIAAGRVARLILVPLSFVLFLALGCFFLYVAYLFVLWAGLIGTLLLVIAILLFVLVIISLSRR